MKLCPCCSQQSFAKCCEPYLLGTHLPASPEALMRSRYTAYTMANITYIKKTMRGKAMLGFKENDARFWAKKVIWLKLEIRNTRTTNKTEGHVEFMAHFMDNGVLCTLHENSKFLRKQNQWFYVDGEQLSI